MKMILASLVILVSPLSYAKNCIPHLTYVYESKGNRVISVALQEVTENESIYYVRGNLHSGDFLDQVTTQTKTCDILSIKNIWSE